MFRIAWRSNASTGGGKFIYTEKEATEYAYILNAKFPQITHWIEKDTSSPKDELKPIKIIGHRCSYGDLSFIPAKSPVSSPEAS